MCLKTTILAAGISLGLLGCGPVSSSDIVGAIEPEECASLTSFGNGAICLDEFGQVNLAVCGDGVDVACTAGRLCFSDALALSCSCTDDAECSGYTSYVNATRSALGQEELAPSCVAGACEADLD